MGGASVFFHISPNRAALSDNNPELISLYQAIKDDPSQVWEHYRAFPKGKEAYIDIRADTDLSSVHRRAARTLYLNRTCFKGMWRHNRRGDFNVGYGGESRRWAIGLEHLETVSRLLNGSSLRCIDFELALDGANPGDFVFLDPPYSPGERSTSSQTQHYLGFDFGFTEQVRLRAALARAEARGISWVMTNTSHPDVLELYYGLPITHLQNTPTSGRGRGEVVISYEGTK